MIGAISQIESIELTWVGSLLAELNWDMRTNTVDA